MSKTFAMLLGDVVSNVLVAEDKATAELVSGAECVEYSEENPAGIGYTYDAEKNLFKPAQPDPSCIWDETSWLWVAPIPSITIAAIEAPTE